MTLVRTMTRSELDLAADWAAAEGWNPGLHDAEAFYAADPEGFLIALDGGTPVACISVVRYGADFGFLGFYIAHPSARGHGHGIAVWNAGMARLAGRNVGLDGVVAQQDNYRKSGFRLAWRNIRFEGSAPPFDAPSGIAVVNAADVPFAKIVSYDRRFFPAPRDAFLARWISLPGHLARVAIRDGEIAGFAVARPCRHGTKIGPLYAETPQTAQALLRAVDTPNATRPLILDVPEPNKAAVALAESLSLKPTFETARMYTGATPEIAMNELFGITSFELG